MLEVGTNQRPNLRLSISLSYGKGRLKTTSGDVDDFQTHEAQPMPKAQITNRWMSKLHG